MSTLEWWRDAILPCTSHDMSRDALFATTATAILNSSALQRRQLGSLLPRLERLTSVPSDFVGTRAYRLLKKHSGDSWGDLGQRSVLDLSAWPACGRRTVEEILLTAMDEWLNAVWPHASDPPAQSEPSYPQTRPTRSNRSLSDYEASFGLRLLCREAYAVGAEHVSEAIALAAAAAETPGSPLAYAWNRFSRLEIAELLKVEQRLEFAWEYLLDFTERELRILDARCPTRPDRPSLATLGGEFAVTPERVRQIDMRCRRTIEARLGDGGCVVIMHHAARLRTRLGTLVPPAALDAALEPLMPGDAEHPALCRDVVLGQAGPYRFEEGFWQAGHPLSQIRAALSAGPGERRTARKLDRLMDEVGVAVEHRDACRAAVLSPSERRLPLGP